MTPVEETFLIYSGASGYSAVTNPVRQQVLLALEERERTLGELVELTGKAKSTLSAVHLKDLLERGLISEEASTRDARVKVYRLVGKRIGGSSIPVVELRAAVRDYATSAQGALAMPFASMAAACEGLPLRGGADEEIVALIGERLGAHASSRLRGKDHEGLLREVGDAWTRDGLARTVRARPRAAGLDVAHAKGASPGGGRCALLRGFLRGALTTRTGTVARVRETTCASQAGTRCTFEVTWAGR